MAEALKVLLAQGWLQERNNRYHLAGHDNVVYRYMATHPTVWGGGRITLAIHACSAACVHAGPGCGTRFAPETRRHCRNTWTSG
jgi:hypothetical protein